MSAAKFRIYKNIVCLETYAPTGHLWWDLGVDLHYKPVPITRIKRWRSGIVDGTRRHVLMALDGHQWVAVNLPRSDIPTLQALNRWPPSLKPPFSSCTYSEHPEKL